MTDPMMTLKSLLAKSSDAGFLRSMIGYTASPIPHHGWVYGAETRGTGKEIAIL